MRALAQGSSKVLLFATIYDNNKTLKIIIMLETELKRTIEHLSNKQITCLKEFENEEVKGEVEFNFKGMALAYGNTVNILTDLLENYNEKSD